MAIRRTKDALQSMLLISSSSRGLHEYIERLLPRGLPAASFFTSAWDSNTAAFATDDDNAAPSPGYVASFRRLRAELGDSSCRGHEHYNRPTVPILRSLLYVTLSHRRARPLSSPRLLLLPVRLRRMRRRLHPILFHLLLRRWWLRI